MADADAATIEPDSDTLARVAAEVRDCRRCRLWEGATNGVPGEGSPNAEVLFIGEGPGFHEDQQGRPFVGAAGHLLNQMLEAIGLRRDAVFITNVVRHRPPGNRDPLPDELAACDTYTMRQVALLRPKLIVTLGRFSMARFFGPNRKISQIHGTTAEWRGITCLAMFHPAAVLRASSAAMRKTYEQDFRRIPPLLAEARAPRRSDEPRGSAPEPAARPGQLPLL